MHFRQFFSERATVCLGRAGLKAAGPGVPKEEETAVPLTDDQFRIRRFRLISGEDITIYCRLAKVRAGMAATYRLYEDAQSRQWMEICINDKCHLISLTEASFEQIVADELLTLGVNKYSG